MTRTYFDKLGFDFDGTLVDSTSAIKHTIQKTARNFDIGLDNVDISHLSSLSLNDYGTYLFIKGKKFEEFKRCFKEIFDCEAYRLVKKRPNVDELFENLIKSGMEKKIFLLTNRRLESVRQLLVNLGITIFGKRVWSASEQKSSENRKQNKLAYILHEFDHPDRSAYVGDAIEDVKAALACKMTSIYINEKHGANDWAMIGFKPQYCFRDIRELINFFRGGKNGLST